MGTSYQKGSRLTKTFKYISHGHSSKKASKRYTVMLWCLTEFKSFLKRFLKNQPQMLYHWCSSFKKTFNNIIYIKLHCDEGLNKKYLQERSAYTAEVCPVWTTFFIPIPSSPLCKQSLDGENPFIMCMYIKSSCCTLQISYNFVYYTLIKLEKTNKKLFVSKQWEEGNNLQVKTDPSVGI